MINFLPLKYLVGICGVSKKSVSDAIPNSYASTYKNKRQVRTDNHTMELNFRKVANEIF